MFSARSPAAGGPAGGSGAPGVTPGGEGGGIFGPGTGGAALIAAPHRGQKFPSACVPQLGQNAMDPPRTQLYCATSPARPWFDATVCVNMPLCVLLRLSCSLPCSPRPPSINSRLNPKPSTGVL